MGVVLLIARVASLASPSVYSTTEMIRCRTVLMKLVTAMFAVAIAYGSVCSAACEAGFCQALFHTTNANECHHAGSGLPGAPSDTPKQPDCPAHGHTTALINVTSLFPYQVPVTDLGLSSLLPGTAVGLVTRLGSFLRTGSAPPSIHGQPRYQQISALRI